MSGHSGGGMDFKLVMVFVSEDRVDEVLDAARVAGATGATMIGQAQGQGLKRHYGLFGLEVMGVRTVLMILVEARRAKQVMDAVTKAGNLDESPETGIAIELDVASATGLRGHIDALAREHPID